MGDKTAEAATSASNMFSYLWEPCCPGETWSCSERGEAAAAGRGQTWPPVARSEQGWPGPGNRGQRLGWRLLCNHPDRGYLQFYSKLSALDKQGGKVHLASEAVIASFML